MTINDSNILKGPKHRVQIDFYRLVDKSSCAWNASYQARKYNPINSNYSYKPTGIASAAHVTTRKIRKIRVL